MNLFRKAATWTAAALLCSALVVFEAGCGNTYRPIANPIFQPGGNPQASDAVGVVNSNGSSAGSTTTIDVSGDTNLGNSTVGVAPGIATFSSGRTVVFVPSTQNDSLTALGSSGSVTVSLQQGSAPVAVVAGSSNVFSLNSGGNADCSVGSVGVIDQTSFVLAQNICLSVVPTYGLVTNNKLFVASKAGNQVAIIDLTSKQVTNVGVGTAPVFVVASIDQNFVFVVNQGSNDVSIINTNTNAVSGPVATGAGPTFEALDTKLNRLYVANATGNSISAFDASAPGALTLLKEIPVGGSPTSLTPLSDGSRVYAALSGTRNVAVVSATSLTKTKSIPTGADATAIVTYVASARTGGKVYAATVMPGDANNGTTVINTVDDSVVTTLPAPFQCDPDTNKNAPCATVRQRPQQIFGGN